MNIKNDLLDILNSLNYNEKIRFLKINLTRVIHLYKIFELMIKSEDLENLSDTYDFNTIGTILENFENYSQDEIDNSIEICEQLIPIYEDYGGVETSIAISVGSSLAETLDYIKSKDTAHVFCVVDEILEIVQFIESEKIQKINPDESDAYLVDQYNLEIGKQVTLAKLVKNGNVNDLEIFLKENMIEYEAL